MWLWCLSWLKNPGDPSIIDWSCPRLSTQVVFTAVNLKTPLTCLSCLAFLLCVCACALCLWCLSSLESSWKRELQIKLSLSNLSHLLLLFTSCKAACPTDLLGKLPNLSEFIPWNILCQPQTQWAALWIWWCLAADHAVTSWLHLGQAIKIQYRGETERWETSQRAKEDTRRTR
jgi:hypothetical protein